MDVQSGSIAGSAFRAFIATHHCSFFMTQPGVQTINATQLAMPGVPLCRSILRTLPITNSETITMIG